MRYQQYKNKMLRIRKVIDVFYHLRFVIAGVVTAIVAGSIALDVSKGSITETSKFEVSYVYGEEIKFSGKAFMGEVTYQFRRQGQGEEAWTDETPKYAGRYEVRARSQGNHGYKYSDITSFEIKPYETTFAIKDEQIPFGNETPELTYTLLPGDHLDENYHVTYDSYVEKTTNANIDVNSLKIYNKDNEDITSSYAITAEPKEITYIPKKLTVTFDTPSPYTFNGNPEGFRYDVYTYQIEGDVPLYNAHVEVTGGISRVEVGSQKNSHTVKVVDDEGNDYSANYDITIKENTITVNKAGPLVISSDSLSKPYDNKPFNISDFGELHVEGLLTNVHEIRNVQFTNTGVVTCEEAKNINNTYTYDIYDIATNEIINPLDYYQSVTNNTGKINITKIPITVYAAGVNSTFTNEEVAGYHDGDPIAYDGDLVGDDFLKVTSYSSYTNVGSSDNNYTCKVYRKEMIDEVLTDVDVSSNYDISYVSGDITISVTPLVIAFDGRTVTYNGQQQYMYENSGYGYLKEGSMRAGWSLNAILYKNPNATSPELVTMKDVLGNGEKYRADESNVYLEIRDDKGNLVTNQYRVDKTPGNDGGTYDVTFEFGESVVEKADLSITVTDFDDPITFNNKALSQNIDLNSRVSSTGLMPGDSLKVDYKDSEQKSIKNASDTAYNIGLDIEVINSSTQQSVAHNYNVTYNRDPQYSEVSINKKAITIQTPNVEKYYDGTNALPLSTLQFADGPNGEKITYTNKEYAAPSAEAGLYTYTSFDVNDIKISLSGQDVTSNYDITFLEVGEINIKKRPIEISQVTSTKDYIFYDKQNHGVFDGSNEVVYTQEQKDKGLLASLGHSISFTLPQYRFTPGSDLFGNGLTNSEKIDYYGVSILDSEMNSVKDNYEITFKDDYVKINIIKKRIEITSGNKQKVFDGNKLDLYPSCNDGVYYDITNFNTSQFQYAVKRYDASKGEYVTTTLNSGHRIQVTKTLSSELDNSMNVGTHYNEFLYKVVDENDNDVSDYYDYAIVNGFLDVYKLNINVYCDNRYGEYDGNDISYPTGNLNVTENTRNSGAYLVFSYTNGVAFDKNAFYQNYSIKASFANPGYPDYYFARLYTFTVDFDIYTTGASPVVYENTSNVSLNTHHTTYTYNVAKIALQIKQITQGATQAIRLISSGALAQGDVLYFGSDEYIASSARRPRVWTSEFTEGNVHIYHGGLGGTDVTGCYQISLV